MIGSRPKAVVVLGHLLKGGRSFRVTFANEKSPRTLILDEDYELCQLVQADDGREILLRVIGIDMGPFVKLCERLSDDDVFAVGCSTAMIEMASERTARRMPDTEPARGD